MNPCCYYCEASSEESKDGDYCEESVSAWGGIIWNWWVCGGRWFPWICGNCCRCWCHCLEYEIRSDAETKYTWTILIFRRVDWGGFALLMRDAQDSQVDRFLLPGNGDGGLLFEVWRSSDRLLKHL